MVSVAAFCQKTFWRLFFSKKFDHFFQNIGTINCLKKVCFFLSFFWRQHKLFLGIHFSAFDFFPKPCPAKAQRSRSHSLFNSIEAICYFFVLFLNFFTLILEYAIHFICNLLRFYFNAKKIQVPFVFVHGWHDCMSINDTVKVPIDIKGLSLWWILRFTVFSRDSPENQSIFFPASLLLMKTMVFKKSLNHDNSFHCPKIVPRQWQFYEFMFWHSTSFISLQSVVYIIVWHINLNTF